MGDRKGPSCGPISDRPPPAYQVMAHALAITLDENGARTLQQQLYSRLRDDILARRLRPGERMPATRALATQLAVSRATCGAGWRRGGCAATRRAWRRTAIRPVTARSARQSPATSPTRVASAAT